MSTDMRGVVLSGIELAREIREELTRDVRTLKEKLRNFVPGLAIVQLPNTTTEIELINKISKLNDDPNVHGIIVQMPLDSVNKINSHLITDLVSPAKDVDGSGVPIVGAQAVVLGRSKIVGTPVAELLKWHHATVTVCHSKTKNLPDVVRQADILVVAIGQPELVKDNWIKPGAVVIDCGINPIS
ncbi:c-1-tetrahydrofolate cytoplasmic, partial [Lasius niger]